MPSPEISQAQALIPGAYERNTLTHRQVGAMGWVAIRHDRCANRSEHIECRDDRRSRVGGRRRGESATATSGQSAAASGPTLCVGAEHVSVDRGEVMVSTLVAPGSSVITSFPGDPELVGLATCPSCHTEDQTVTKLAVSTGADWQCARCGSRWDARRVATVAAYAVWVSERTSSEDHNRAAA
jgi:hypothetical protein